MHFNAFTCPFLVTTTLLAFTDASPPLRQGPQVGRIVGGVVSQKGRYPWMVTMGRGHFCGASLVAPRVVLTAGHCMDGTISQVRIGKFDLTASEADSETHRPVRQIRHAQYEAGTWRYDVGVLILARDSAITPVVFAKPGAALTGE